MLFINCFVLCIVRMKEYFPHVMCSLKSTQGKKSLTTYPGQKKPEKKYIFSGISPNEIENWNE